MTTNTTNATASGSTVTTTRTSTYGRHMAGVLVAAFTLSVVHTVYSWVEGIDDPTFTVDTPLAWGFYLVAFGAAALALRTARWAQVTVLAFLFVVLAIGVFYYPTMFGPAPADGVRLVRERRLPRACSSSRPTSGCCGCVARR